MAFFARKLLEGTLTLVDLGCEFAEDGVISWLAIQSALVGVELIVAELMAREGM
jgi:hypothetical protein